MNNTFRLCMSPTLRTVFGISAFNNSAVTYLNGAVTNGAGYVIHGG